jgi:hypothetical protein
MLICIALAGCAVNSGDEDVAVDIEPIVGGAVANEYPEAATLNIDVTQSMYYACSGTLIAPQVVLTAGHCVAGHHHWDVYVGGSYRASTNATVYDWPVLDSDTVSPSYHDVGLVFLSTPIALPSGFPTIAAAPYPRGTKALNVGRDVGPDALHYTITASLFEAPIAIETTSPSYPFDYSSTDVIQPGDSGGPVFLSGTHTIIAVNSGAAAGVSEVMARVDLVAGWIATQVTSHGGSGAVAGSVDAGPIADVNVLVADGNLDANAPALDASPMLDVNAPVADASPMLDANAPVADAASQADASGDAGAAACAAPVGVAPNSTWHTATPITKGACGTLTPTADIEWYALTVGPGSHLVELLSTGNARMGIGIANGMACTITLPSALGAAVSVSGASATLCIVVQSPTRAIQSYHIVVAP